MVLLLLLLLLILLLLLFDGSAVRLCDFWLLAWLHDGCCCAVTIAAAIAAIAAIAAVVAVVMLLPLLLVVQSVPINKLFLVIMNIGHLAVIDQQR